VKEGGERGAKGKRDPGLLIAQPNGRSIVGTEGETGRRGRNRQRNKKPDKKDNNPTGHIYVLSTKGELARTWLPIS